MQTLIAVHCGGAGRNPSLENTDRAFELSASSDVEFVELTVHRCADGKFVVHSNPVVEGLVIRDHAADELKGVRLVDDVLARVGDKGILLHLDIQTSQAVYALRHVAERHNPRNLIMSTTDRTTARALKIRSSSHYSGLVQVAYRATRMASVATHQFTGADLLSVNAELASWARLRPGNTPLVVTGVDTPEDLYKWLSPGRAEMVVTNQPMRAMRTRQGHAERQRRPASHM